MATFRLSIVAPDRSVVDATAQSVIAPGIDGYLGVMAGHEPLICALRPGVLEYRDAQGQRNHVMVGGGFLETSGDQVIILADSASLASEIDIKEAEAMLERARAALRGENSTLSAEEATKELDLAMNRIKAARMR